MSIVEQAAYKESKTNHDFLKTDRQTKKTGSSHPGVPIDGINHPDRGPLRPLDNSALL